ncbi:MAG: ATP phosphoribosyltransferase [Candidatus Bipolaricaulota bacterium]
MRVVLPRGRLFERSLKILNDAYFDFSGPDDRSLISEQGEHELLLAKAFDVPVYVEKGSAIGITGKDVVEERGSDLFIPLTLPFGQCRLSLAMPEGVRPQISNMEGYTIATEYPRLTERFFEAQGVKVEILTMEGSTELAPVAGIADGIVDIVQTGSTLRANGLVEVHQVMEVAPLLLVNRVAQKTRFEEINHLISQVKGVIRNGA